MRTVESLQQQYETLANRYAHQGEARQRDHCLVLAADAALNAGQPDQAERLRKRLLLTNPHHLLRPFSSMTEAMQSSDVQDYVSDLRRQWPPETVEKLLRKAPVAEEDPPTVDVETVPLAPENPAAAPATKKSAKAKKSQPPGALTLGAEDVPIPVAGVAGYALAMIVVLIGVALAGGVMFYAFAGPLME